MSPDRFVYLFWPDYENALEEELRFSGVKFQRVPRGLEVSGADRPPEAAFCRQVVVNPELLKGASIRSLAEKLSEILPDGLSDWQFHSFSAMEKGGERRAELVTEALTELFKKKRRQTLRALNNEGRSGPLLQHIVLSNEESFVSYVSAEQRASLGYLVNPFSGANANIEEDKRPPARAYRKLLEATKLFGREIESMEKVVDLGSSPGSWAWVALQRGATVVGVDRSAVEDIILYNPRFSFQSGDAFKFVPEQKVDWLLCDVIAEPERSVQMLSEWLEAERMRFFCVTMKFKGEKRAESLNLMRNLLNGRCKRWLLKHLQNNGHEATAIGEVKH